MQLDSEKVGDILVLTPVEKRIDVTVSAAFKSAMVDWIGRENSRILLDLTNVDFIDSSGLGAIISSLKTLGGGGDLVLCGIQENVKSLFELTRMHRIFKIYEMREDALQAMAT